jgi:hypothetical protein
VFFLGEEFADVFDRAYQNHDSGAGDPEKEDDLEQTHAKNNKGHKRLIVSREADADRRLRRN